MSKKESVWRDISAVPSFSALDKDIKTDVLIIGGGIAGILTAYYLQNKGVDYTLVEKGRVLDGVTKNTTAKITLQHGLIYHKLLKRLGHERTQMYLAANQRALETYRDLCSGMDCDFESADNYVYSTRDRRILDKELAALENLKVQTQYVQNLPLPMHTEGAVCVPAQAQFHPLKFAYSICRDLRIFEHTRVLEICPDFVRTQRGTIHAKRIIVATHFPILNKHGSYFMKLYQHRSYVLALDCDCQLQGMYVDEDDKGMSFRRHGSFLLLGGGSHRTGRKGGGYRELHDFASRQYPGVHHSFEWATQDCMTLDGVPYIGRYSARTSDLYVATGFNK